MSADAPALNKFATWQPLQATLADFREECGGLESLLQGLFEDLERLRCELERKAFELDAERQRAAERESQLLEQREDTRRLANHFEDQDQRLAETLASLNELRAQLAREQDTDSLQKQLNAAHGELLRMAKTSGELADARAEMFELRKQLESASTAGIDSSRLTAIEQERNAAQAEADALRVRNAELQQTVADQRGAMDQHRDELTGELKQLRKFVELQTGLLTPRVAASAGHGRDGADSVANSVAAQFNKLQRDVAERRKTRA